MRALCSLVVCLLLLAPVSGQATTYTYGPDEMGQFVSRWYVCHSDDVIQLEPGTYVLSGSGSLPLTSSSPTLMGLGGAEGVVLLGGGSAPAFFIEENVWDAHIHFEGLTFRSITEIIGRATHVSSGGGDLYFTDNIVEYCGTSTSDPGFRVTECSGTIARNIFRHNYGCAIQTYHTHATIEDNEIYGNGGGIWDMCCTSATTRRNHIHDNSGAAISTGYYQGGTLEYNVIERNGGVGISMGRVGAIRYNVIRENAIGVVSSSWTGASAAVIHYNDICDNTQANLKVTTSAVQSWDCTMNWWGSTDPATISEGIWDCNDDPEAGACVVFEPFCDFPGCAAVPVERASWGSIKALYR